MHEADVWLLHAGRCVKKLGDDNLSDVSEQMCDRRTKPREVNYCLIPCPGHCVVSAWSEWTHCPQVYY